MSLKCCIKVLPAISRTIISCSISRYEVSKIFSSHSRVLGYVTYLQTRPNSSETKRLNINSTKLVYNGILKPQIKAVKLFSLSSSIVGILAQPFLYKEIASTGNVPIIVAAYSFIGFFTLVTPVLLHLITRKYVTELHYKPDSDTYVAKTINFFCITKEVEFKVEDVKVPDVPGMFTTLIANGKPLFLDPRSFENPGHYAKLMGYDKPIDFKLYENNSEKK